jgi:hypothetical protein
MQLMHSVDERLCQGTRSSHALSTSSTPFVVVGDEEA